MCIVFFSAEQIRRIIESYNILSWKGCIEVIKSNSLLFVGVPETKLWLRPSSKHFLNSDRLDAMTTSLGSLFQWLTTLSVKNLFQMSNLIFPWCSFTPFSHVLLLVTRERISAPPSPLLSLRNCTLQWGYPSACSSLSWTNQVTSATPQKSCPQDLSPSWLLSSGHTLTVWCLSSTEVPKTARYTCGWAAPVQCKVGQSLSSTS